MNRIWRKYLVYFDSCSSYLSDSILKNVLIIKDPQDKVFVSFHDYLIIFSDEDFNTDLISAMFITGKNLANNKKAVKKKPKVNI